MFQKACRWLAATTPSAPSPSTAPLSDPSQPPPATASAPPVQADAAPRRRGQPHGDREVLVIGLGRFGTSLAKSLVHDGHDVLAVDADYARVQLLSSELPHVVQIDATNEDALREIGADHFDTGVVCIGTDF